MKDKLLEKMFEYDRWISLIDKAEEKGINKSILRQLCIPEQRLRLYEAIKSENYEVSPPRIILIPKDTPGEFREVKANEDVDRIVLTLINDCLFELFPNRSLTSSLYISTNEHLTKNFFELPSEFI